MKQLNSRGKNISGKTFGRLKVTEEWYVGGARSICWLCVCNCGNKVKVWVDGARLRSGATRSCGCLNIEHMKRVALSNKIEYSMSSKKRLFRRYASDAKRRDLSFSLTFDEFMELTKSNCTYCDRKPSSVQKADGGNGDYIYNGIDRIISNLGYKLENCLSCCSVCNLMKGSMNRGDFMNQIKKIYKHG